MTATSDGVALQSDGSDDSGYRPTTLKSAADLAQSTTPPIRCPVEDRQSATAICEVELRSGLCALAQMASPTTSSSTTTPPASLVMVELPSRPRGGSTGREASIQFCHGSDAICGSGCGPGVPGAPGPLGRIWSAGTPPGPISNARQDGGGTGLLTGPACHARS